MRSALSNAVIVRRTSTFIGSRAGLSQRFSRVMESVNNDMRIGKGHLVITSSHRDLVITSLFRWKMHWRIAVFTRTATSWTMLETGSDFMQRNSMSRLCTPLWKHVSCAFVSLDIKFKKLCFFIQRLLFRFHLIHFNTYWRAFVFLKKNLWGKGYTNMFLHIISYR